MYRFIPLHRLLLLIAPLLIVNVVRGHDGPHPAINLTGDWVITFKVLQAGGECEVGVVSVENTTLTHNISNGEVEVRGVLDNPNEVVVGHVSENEEGDLIFSYEGQFREDGGWTERSVELVIADDWDSMDGFEDWEWGLSSNPNAPDECPNSRSSLSAVRGGPGAPTVTWTSPVSSFTNQFDQLTRSTSLGRQCMELWDEFRAEFFGILISNPDIGGEAVSVASELSGIFSDANDVIRVSHVEVGSGGEIASTYQMIQPAAAALISGNGESVTVTQEMIDSVQGVVDMVKAQASDDLVAALELETNPLSDLQQFLGKTVLESAASIGLTSELLSVIVYDPARSEGQFEVSIDRMDGVAFSLSKTLSIEDSDWTPVSNTIEETEGSMLKLIDPNPGGAPVFYRVELTPDESGSSQ